MHTPTEADLRALVEAALEDDKSYGEIVKLLRNEDQTMSLRCAAEYCRVVLGRIGTVQANLMLSSLRGLRLKD